MPMMLTFKPLDAVVLASAISWAYFWLLPRQRRAHGARLPPGPKGLPIIGNLLDMPDKDGWETARQWGEKYGESNSAPGDLVHVEVFGMHQLFINSYEAAIDLLERRGNIYSSRPKTTMLELEGWDTWFMPAMANNDELNKFRQYFNMFFQKSAMKDYYEVQTQSAHSLLLRLLDNPEDYRAHVKYWAAEAIIKVAYGYDISENDPHVELVDKVHDAFSAAVQFFAVNALPALRHLPAWFPGTHFLKLVQEGREVSVALQHEPFVEAKGKMASGVAVPSMISKLLELSEDSSGSVIDEASIAKITSVTYAGGGDTTVAALLIFILAMVLHPDAAKKGQEELDRVIGKNNLPTIEDKRRLPYIEAICTECLRWNSVSPIGMPHLVEKDDVYNGYFIHAGTTVIPYVWAMLRDPKRYPDPEKFIPERWLLPRDQEQPLDARKIAFGFGRRICPGRFFADNSIFIAVACILATFDIQTAVDEKGEQIVPSEEFISGLVRHPKPFKCRITPRSDEAATLIRQAASAAR